jgi:AraC family transcriptional regulator
MTRVLKTKPVRMASDPTGAAITCWKHDPPLLHEVVAPMAEHVIMTFPAGSVRFERRTGKEVVHGMTRPGTVMVIPAGSSSRWNTDRPSNAVQLYLPPATLQRVAHEADMAAPGDLLERSAHPDPVTSRLLLSAADALEGSAPLDSLFRHQLTDLLATRLLAAHVGSPATFQPVMGGLSPKVLCRAIERLRSDSDADVSLAALAADAGLSRFHFCRAFKESTGLSPHAWRRQHQLEQALNMLRDTDDSIVSIAAALGYSSQTAFAAAFRKLTGEPPSGWRRRMR